MADKRSRLDSRPRPGQIIGYRRNGAPIRLQAGGAPDGDTIAIPSSMDDLRGRTPEELHAMLRVLDAHLRSLHQTDAGEIRELDDDEKQAFDLGLQMRDECMRRIDEHNKIAAVFRRRPESVQAVYDNLRTGASDDDPIASIRMLTSRQATDRALRVLDTDSGDAELQTHQVDQVERAIRKSPTIARRVLVTENEHYRTAWMKMVTDPHPILTPEENRAVQAWYEFRAMGEVTGTAGGMGVPVFLDPSIILTAQDSGNPFLTIARQVNISTNDWKGVTSAGVSWTFQTEAAAATDASPTLAQPEIRVHMARGFIPYSIEVAQDYPGFASEMAALLASGYDELLVDKLTRGSGTGEPKGILTAISATAGDRVTLTAAPTIGAADPYKVWKALPQKYRRRAQWLMNVGVNNAIRQLATANVYHATTVNLPEAWADVLFNRPVYESPYMPDVTGTTASTDSMAIVGDFSNYVLVRNGGMSVELIPQLFQQVTAGSGPAVPTGQRGWFAYARIGADASNTSAFRALVVS